MSNPGPWTVEETRAMFEAVDTWSRVQGRPLGKGTSDMWEWVDRFVNLPGRSELCLQERYTVMKEKYGVISLEEHDYCLTLDTAEMLAWTVQSLARIQQDVEIRQRIAKKVRLSVVNDSESKRPLSNVPRIPYVPVYTFESVKRNLRSRFYSAHLLASFETMKTKEAYSIYLIEPEQRVLSYEAFVNYYEEWYLEYETSRMRITSDTSIGTRQESYEIDATGLLSTEQQLKVLKDWITTLRGQDLLDACPRPYAEYRAAQKVAGSPSTSQQGQVDTRDPTQKETVIPELPIMSSHRRIRLGWPNMDVFGQEKVKRKKKKNAAAEKKVREMVVPRRHTPEKGLDLNSGLYPRHFPKGNLDPKRDLTDVEWIAMLDYIRKVPDLSVTNASDLMWRQIANKVKIQTAKSGAQLKADFFSHCLPSINKYGQLKSWMTMEITDQYTLQLIYHSITVIGVSEIRQIIEKLMVEGIFNDRHDISDWTRKFLLAVVDTPKCNAVEVFNTTEEDFAYFKAALIDRK